MDIETSYKKALFVKKPTRAVAMELMEHVAEGNACEQDIVRLFAFFAPKARKPRGPEYWVWMAAQRGEGNRPQLQYAYQKNGVMYATDAYGMHAWRNGREGTQLFDKDGEEHDDRYPNVDSLLCPSTFDLPVAERINLQDCETSHRGRLIHIGRAKYETSRIKEAAGSDLVALIKGFPERTHDSIYLRGPFDDTVAMIAPTIG